MIKFLTNNIPLISSDTIQHGLDAFNWITDFKIETKNIQNPITDDKFYFIHYISYHSIEEIVDLYTKKNEYSEFINNLLENNNFRLIIIDVHEVHEYEHIEKITTSFKHKNKVLFVNNDLRIYEKNIWGINVEKTNHLIKNSIKGWVQKPLLEYSENRDKLFLSVNKSMKPHRRYFLSLLMKDGILKNTNYSALDFELTSNYKVPSFDMEYYESIKNNLEILSNQGSKNTNYENFNIKNINSNFNFAGEINILDYKNSYVNLVTESVYFNEMIHISEKSFKPFAFYQLPIYIASPNHVKKLKEYYEMDLYDDIIDHSYDLEIDDTKRMMMIIEQINYLNDNANLVEDYFKNNHQRFLNNFEQIKKIQSVRDDYLLKKIIEF